MNKNVKPMLYLRLKKSYMGCLR